MVDFDLETVRGYMRSGFEEARVTYNRIKLESLNIPDIRKYGIMRCIFLFSFIGLPIFIVQ